MTQAPFLRELLPVNLAGPTQGDAFSSSTVESTKVSSLPKQISLIELDYLKEKILRKKSSDTEEAEFVPVIFTFFNHLKKVKTENLLKILDEEWRSETVAQLQLNLLGMLITQVGIDLTLNDMQSAFHLNIQPIYSGSKYVEIEKEYRKRVQESLPSALILPYGHTYKESEIEK